MILWQPKGQDRIVIEDSPGGVRATVAARVNVLALATPFTTGVLHASQPLEHAPVVYGGERLAES